MILLDTDVCIELLRGNEQVVDKLAQLGQQASIAFMTMGELYFGAYKSTRPAHNQNLVDALVKTVEVIQSDPLIMMKFGKLKAELTTIGRPLPDADVLIAATTLVHCNVLATGNEVHFARFAELSTENWIR